MHLFSIFCKENITNQYRSIKPFITAVLCVALSAFTLGGCADDSDKPNQPSSNTNAVNPSSNTSKDYPLPVDADLADTYTQTCQSCHGSGIGSAPRAGDQAAWQSRLDKGMPALLKNTVNGYGGMPALGACADCDREDFTALIQYMAGIPIEPTTAQ